MTDTPVASTTERTRALVEQAYRAFGARDVPTLLALLTPDVEWGEAANPLIPSAGMRRGVDGVVEWLRIGQETEDIRSFELHRLLVDGDMAAAIGRMHVVARRTGKAYEMDFVHLVTVENGRISRFVEFFDTWTAAEAFRP